MVLLPEGSEVTLSELREMAARQQQQIEAQQQLLVAKEQRLKFLKQQEARHHQQSNNGEGVDRLRHLREKVESQELKLRRLRALRGQTDQQRQSNTNLTAELESIRAIFNEKEKELSLAVAKVEELTRQLEQLRQGNGGAPSKTSPAAIELDKLRRELVYRTKLNEQQNARIIQQRETLTKRQEEISATDQRIAELQQRLHRKRIINQQLASQIHAATLAKQAQLRQSKGGQRLRPVNNIAAVEPLKRVPQEPDRSIQDDLHAKLKAADKDLGEFTPNKNDPKYQTLPYNTRFLIKPNGNDTDDATEKKPPEKRHEPPPPAPASAIRTSPTGGVVPPASKIAPPQHSLTNFAPRPFGTTYSSSLLGPMGIGRLPVAVNGGNGAPNGVQVQVVGSSLPPGMPSQPSIVTSGSVTSSVPSIKYNSSVSSGIPVQRSKLPSANNGGSLPPTPMTSTKNGNYGAVQPTVQRSDPQPASQPQAKTHTEHSENSPHRSHSDSSEDVSTDATDRSKPALPPKPSVPAKPVPPPRQTHVVAIAGANGSKRPDLDSALLVLKGNNGAKSSNGYRYVVKPPQSFASRLGPASMDQYTKAINHLYMNEVPKDQPSVETDSFPENLAETLETDGGKRGPGGHLPIRPRPLTIKKPSGLDPPRLKSSISNGIVSPTRRQSDQNSQIPVPMNLAPSSRKIELPALFHFPENTESNGQPELRTDVVEKRPKESSVSAKDPSPLDTTKTWPQTEVDSLLDTFNGNTPSVDSENVELSSVLDNDSESSLDNGKKQILTDTLSETSHEEGEDLDVAEQNNINNHNAVYRRVKKGNLKTKGSGKSPRRVSFDPLALLLDASLEGELELVKKTAKEVSNPSAANDEGITALHNAICAGHFEIVTFLVEFGCDVNAQDSDGWTPLHCAASCNNLPMVKFLVEHGACIFSTTLSDHETAAQKCEEEEEGFDGCSEYLYSVQEKLGILNGGAVYAVYDYDAQNPDELSFKDSDMLVVLRKGDDLEREWWWAKLRDREGYVPRNLLGLHPRVAMKED